MFDLVYIPLDIFRKMPHNELTKLDAWLYFLGSDYPQDILRITEKYPLFRQLYQEIIDFRFHPKDLITMYSEALRIMDENTVSYMIDELKAQIIKQKEESDAVISQKNAVISRKDAVISQHEVTISQLTAEIQFLRESQTHHNSHNNSDQ